MHHPIRALIYLFQRLENGALLQKYTHTRSRERDGVVAFTGAATTSSNKFRLFYFLVARLAHPT
jgi:hypothetical protein